ncbi:TetR/AcrR family transcriptional regulator [Candidatus Methylocalor cossyra]|uniref:TetR family transcriptional regulator n=1 Tax=Candidatus Methylocalor cossyra TaxID=3108543 RepID=A0ABM9NJ42_9GAMM
MQPASSVLFPDLCSRRAKVLRAALRLFTQRGFFNTSLQMIVSESGASVGFIYHHFRDKEGIARALYHHLLERMNALLDDIEAAHRTAEERCRAVIKLLFELTEAEGDSMGFIAHARHREFLPNEKAICSASAFVRMRGFVFEGIEKGEIRPMDPMVAAVIAYGGAIRMIGLRLDGVIEQPLSGYLEELWAHTWQALHP